MSADGTVLVRLQLDVEHLKHTTLRALVARADEVQGMVNDEIDRLTESGALEAQIQEAVERHVREAIEDGARAAIRGWVRESPTIRAIVQEGIEAALRNLEAER